jgi:hypothetical protein
MLAISPFCCAKAAYLLRRPEKEGFGRNFAVF